MKEMLVTMREHKGIAQHRVKLICRPTFISLSVHYVEKCSK
jgi:hypothetical protein